MFAWYLRGTRVALLPLIVTGFTHHCHSSYLHLVQSNHLQQPETAGYARLHGKRITRPPPYALVPVRHHSQRPSPVAMSFGHVVLIGLIAAALGAGSWFLAPKGRNQV